MAIKPTPEQLGELIEELKEQRGRATELITVYVPAGNDVNTAQKQLEGERSTAKNIKSTSTRKNVIDSLDKIIRTLKEYRKTPENGLALFAGDASSGEDQSDIQLWEIEPPQPLEVRLYRCDKEFVLDPLEDMLKIGEIYALAVMDRKEATIGRLIGKRIEMFQNMTSGIPGKVKAGGQSAQRFHRITEGLTKDFYKRIAEEIKKNFYDEDRLKGILIGGPIPTKDEFIDGEFLPTKLQEKIIGVKDQGDTSESGLQELVKLSQDVLADQEIIYEKKLLEKFFNMLGKDSVMAPYKLDEIKKALEMGAVGNLIFSNKLDKEIVKEIKPLAVNIGSTIEFVSDETDEGKQFLNLGGIAALLRFRVS
jgi:peptide chain release factor subunit 1